MGAPAITSALNTFQPVCISRSPNGELLITNGINGPLRWDFLTSTAEDLGIAGPTNGPTLTDSTSAGSVSASLQYLACYRYQDRDSTPSNLSIITKLTTSASANHQITYGSIAQSSQTRPDRVELFRTTGGEATVFYHDTTIALAGSVATVTNSGGFCKFLMATPHRLPVGAVLTVSGTSVSGYNTTHTVTGTLDSVTFITSVSYSSNATGGSWVATGYASSQRSDTSLSSGGGNISSSTSSTTNVQYTTDVAHGLVVGQLVFIADHSINNYNTLHQTVIAAPTATTFVTDATYTSGGSGGTWTHELDWILPLTNPDGTINANRFTPPPNFKACSANFQDRIFYGVDVEYNVGTIAVTNDGTSKTVTGTGTLWTSQMAGRVLYIVGDTKSYKIKSVASSTSLTLTEIYQGSTGSGKSYAIRPPQSELNQLYFSETLEPESVPDTNTIRIQNSTGEDDELVGMMPSSRSLYLLQRRHIYRLNFVAQPAIDVSVKLLASRGCVNNRAWCLVEDVPYVLDYYGIYRINSDSSISPVSGPIQDMFRDGVIDMTQAKWFFAQKDPVLEIVRFFYAESGETRPKHAVCINYRSGAIWTEDYVWELGGAVILPISSRVRMLVGGENETIYKTVQGTLDGTAGSGTTRGSVSSASTNTLSDLTATFPADVATGYASIAILSGTGKGQVRKITTRNSDHQVTVSTDWDTIPDTTSVYQIGAIEYQWRSNSFRLAESDHESQRGVRLVAYPTAGASTMDVRCYYNADTDPRNYRQPGGFGDGVQIYPDDPSAVVDLKLTRSDKANATGFYAWDFPGRIDARSAGGDRWLAIELAGFQSADPIRVRSLEILGAVG